MIDTTAVVESASGDTPEISIVEDVNDAADEATGLGCGDDNPYQ
jgi:hypothetical protein